MYVDLKDPVWMQWVLPALSCAMLTAICLAARFSGKGRLLASWHSAALTLSILLVTTGATLVTSHGVLSHLARVPPLVIGVAAGGTLVPRRSREESNGVGPWLAVLTLGTAWLLNRLEERLHLDCAAWCDEMTTGFTEYWELDVFLHELQIHLSDRVTDRKQREAVEKRFKEAVSTVEASRAMASKAEELRRQAAPVGLPEQRQSLDEAEALAHRCAFGTARASCHQLLMTAWIHGRRTGDREIAKLKKASVKSTLALVKDTSSTPPRAERRSADR